MTDLDSRKIVFYCDFDGTVTTGDVTDILLEKLADKAWHTIEERWVKGEIDDCQCMGQQIALIRGDWPAITKVMDSIAIDPYFKQFISLCKRFNTPVYIGSNGLDRVIEYILQREGLQVSGFWSYKLIEKNNSWSLDFPLNEARGKCQTPNSISCKCALMEHKLDLKNPYRIVIGDSKSDFCWSNKADFVFAKKKLAQFCREQNIPYQGFIDFSQIIQYLEREIFQSKDSFSKKNI